MTTKIEGIHYLLNTAKDNGCEWVSRYEASELQSEFSFSEREKLASGFTITRGTGRQAYTVIDMVASTRAMRDRQFEAVRIGDNPCLTA